MCLAEKFFDIGDILNKIRRICFFGGPNTGKSHAAADVFSILGKKGYSIEQVREYVKDWAYEKREVTSFDQVYLLAKQIRMEDLALRNGVELIVTDCPVLISTCYAKDNGFEAWRALLDLSKGFEKSYPSLSLFLDRGDLEYKPHGRYQTEKEAIAIDSLIKEMLSECVSDYHILDCRDLDGIMDIIFQNISKPQS